MPARQSPPFLIAEATPQEREELASIRHEVYAGELGQHPPNPAGRLSDAIDAHNVFIVARVRGALAGFISLTPPGAHPYSIDKYFARAELPFARDDGLFEIRLLTVRPAYRGRELAVLLMYAASRWVEAHGGTRVMAIGRREVLGLYRWAGLVESGRGVRAGAVDYELLEAPVGALRARAEASPQLIDRFEARTDWRLDFPLRPPAPCFHGGAAFDAIGAGFEDLDRRHGIINADVLDAWFPPAPGVLAALGADLPWLAATAPPTDCGGLVAAIARARGVRAANILPGAGSSDLIFRALRHWLTPRSRVTLLDPTYGEYAHVLERVLGCRVERLPLRRDRNYDVDLADLDDALARQPDLVVLVNPNSPTGRQVPRADLEPLLRRAPARTRIWVDETYVDYAGPGESLEAFAAASPNVVVCKSMSKVYALSGLRVAYLVARAPLLEGLRAITPPWAVGLPAQVAAVRALADPAYYAARRAETHALRAVLAARLVDLGWAVVPGVANFVLGHLPAGGLDAAGLVRACRERGLFLRDAAAMGAELGPRAVRVAVKDAATNERMLAIIAAVLRRAEGGAA